MPAINPYLTFNGNCAEAMHFYQSTLGGKLQMMTNGESPVADQLPPDSKDRIMHARLEFDEGVLMASDGMPNVAYKGMHGFGVSIIYPTAAEASRVFDALAKGGKVGMPLGKAFWS